MWGELQFQGAVGGAESQEPRVARQPGGWWKRRLWRALSSCASVSQLPVWVCCQAFAGGSSAAIDNRDRVAAQWKMVRISWNLPISANSVTTSNLDALQRSVATASLRIPDLMCIPPSASCNLEPRRKGIVGMLAELFDTEPTITTWTLSNKAPESWYFFPTTSNTRNIKWRQKRC